MASNDNVLKKEVAQLLRDLETKLRTSQPKPSSSARSAQATPASVPKSPVWKTNRREVKQVLKYLRRDLKDDFNGRIGHMGNRYSFTQENTIEVNEGQTVHFPALQELIDTYKSRYPQQIDAHLVGRQVLEHLLSDPQVTGVKIAYGLLPGYEQTLGPVQRLIVETIYRLQRLLLEESREPRQVILTGIRSDGRENRHLSASEPQPKSPSTDRSGLHGTPYSLPAGLTLSVPSPVPPITMGPEEAGYETLPTCPPNGR